MINAIRNARGKCEFFEINNCAVPWNTEHEIQSQVKTETRKSQTVYASQLIP